MTRPIEQALVTVLAQLRDWQSVKVPCVPVAVNVSALQLERSEFAAIVAACTARLPARQREILTLRNGQHLSYRAISRLLNIGLGTAKSRIARARDSLRSKLGEDFKI